MSLNAFKLHNIITAHRRERNRVVNYNPQIKLSYFERTSLTLIWEFISENKAWQLILYKVHNKTYLTEKSWGQKWSLINRSLSCSRHAPSPTKNSLTIIQPRTLLSFSDNIKKWSHHDGTSHLHPRWIERTIFNRFQYAAFIYRWAEWTKKGFKQRIYSIKTTARSMSKADPWMFSRHFFCKAPCPPMSVSKPMG